MIYRIGSIGYEACLSLQLDLVGRRLKGEIEDSIIIAEHHPVFTIGRTGKSSHLLVNQEKLSERGIQVLDADRGGSITYHGPGQIVVYPILNLRLLKLDLHSYIRALEVCALTFLSRYGISGQQKEGKSGVWVQEDKIAFIGIAVRNWVSYHGMSINVDCDLDPFSMMQPCGFPGLSVTTLHKSLNRKTPILDAVSMIEDVVRERFMSGKDSF